MSDAQRRALRTLLQGAIAVALVTVGQVVNEAITSGQPLDLKTLAPAAITAVTTAVLAYAQRQLEARRGKVPGAPKE